MRFYKLENCVQELYYSNLKLLCESHDLIYRSVYNKIRERKEPYHKGNIIVTECEMITRNKKEGGKKRKENPRSNEPKI